MDRVVALVVTVAAALVVVSAVAPAAGHAVAPTRGSVVEQPGAAAVDQRSATIEKHVTLFLTPDEPGRIDAAVEYRLPESVSSLSVSLPDRTAAVETSDFEETADDYEWDNDGDTAQLRVTVAANRSAAGSRAGAVAQSGEHSFVDAGDWALVTVPTIRTGWGWSGPADLTVGLTQSTTVDGEGSTGGEVAYLGPVTEHTRTANGQRFTLAVPDRASLVERPAAVFEALAAASERLRVGDRDDEVWLGVAPTGADWGVRGVEYGGSDAWVLADAQLDEPANVWLHEYVHTRQAYTTTASGRWTTEATAEYYAAALSLKLGYVEFEQFQRYLADGQRRPWRDAVLTSPPTWPSGADYLKGGLVWGELDRQVRLATDQTASMTDVLYAMNQQDGNVSNADVLAAVRSVAGSDVAAVVDRYTTSDASPSIWYPDDHAAAFDTEPPRLTYSDREYRVTGPFRNETLAGPPGTLYAGETLTFTASVVNDGGVPGTYEVALDRDGERLVTDTGPLSADESARVQVEHTADDTGPYTLAVGRDHEQVAVRSPSTPRVTDLAVEPARVEPGDTVTVTATLSNPGEHPASGPVAVTLDGQRAGALNATLASGETASRSVTVTLPQAQQYEVSAGDRAVSARAGEPNASVPGPGLAGAALVVAITAGALAVRRGQ